MARSPRWTDSALKDGVKIITLSSWKYFSDFINQQLLDYRTYNFRGHTRDDWMLESTLDRLLSKIGRADSATVRIRHLENFKQAARGRRGLNPPNINDENGWWALGQHYGLATPLLDWTESPFVALYFAFEEEQNEGSKYRVVYALSESSVREKSLSLKLDYDIATISAVQKAEEASPSGSSSEPKRQLGLPGRITGPPPPQIVEIIRPLSDENSRLVSQRALFVRGPDGIPLETWVQRNFKEDTHWILIKIRIPNRARDQCLRSLNRMNISHLSLFPDLYGASRYCNTDLVIKNY